MIKKKLKFNSIGAYVNHFNLHEDIAQREEAYKDEDHYGLIFEDAVIKQLQKAGINAKRTGSAYDFIKGADLRMVFGDSSILVDVKLNMKKAMKGNLFYVGDALEFSRKKENIFFYPLNRYIEVGFTLKNIRKSDKGYCTLKKPVLVAIFRFNVKIENQHRLFTIDAAKELAKYVYYINLELHRSEGYPLRDSNSFLFTPYNNKIKHWRYENGTNKCTRANMHNRSNNHWAARSGNNNTSMCSKKQQRCSKK